MTNKWAANFVDFCLNSEFLGASSTFPRQLVLGSLAANEVCFHCSNVDWLKHWYKEGYNYLSYKYDTLYIGDGSSYRHRVVVLSNGCCSKCGRTKEDLVAEGYNETTDDLSVVSGSRSGLTTLGILVSLYWAHQTLRVGLGNGGMVTYGLVTTQVGVVWSSLLNTYKNTKWFQEHGGVIGENTITYPDKNFQLIVSNDPESLRSLRLAGYTIDDYSFVPVETRNAVMASAIGSRSSSPSDLPVAGLLLCSKGRNSDSVCFEKLYKMNAGTKVISSKCPDWGLDESTFYSLGKRETGLHVPTYNFNPQVSLYKLQQEFEGCEGYIRNVFGAIPVDVSDPDSAEMDCDPICETSPLAYGY